MKSVKNSLLYLSHTTLSGILIILLMSIVTHKLSSGELGEFVLIQTYTVIAVGIANLGVLTAYDRNFFLYEKSKTKTYQLISSALIFVLFSLIFLFTILYYFKSFVFYIVPSGSPPEEMFFTVFIGTSALSLSQYYLTFLKNSGQAKIYVKFMIGNSFINFIITLVLLYKTNLNVLALAYAWLISNVMLLFALFSYHINEFKLSFSKNLMFDMLRISLPLTPRIFFGFLNTKFDKIMLGLLGSTQLVGVYYIGQLIAVIIFQFMTAIGKVFQPEIYRKLFADEHANNSLEISNYLLPFFYFSIFMALLIVLFSREFIAMFFSFEFEIAVPIIMILSIYYSSLFFAKVTGAQLIFAKKTHITTFLMFLGIAINVGLNIPLITYFGVLGAAWATTISGVLMTLISYFVARKYVTIKWQWKSIFVISIIFLCAVTLSMFDYVLQFPLYASLLLKFLTITFYFSIGFTLDIVSKEEIRKLLLRYQ